MEFVYHHRTVGRGGEGVHIASLVRALEAEGHHVTVVSPPGVDPLATLGCAPVDKANQRLAGLQRVWQWISRRSPLVLFELLELGYNVYALVRLLPLLRHGTGAVLYERYVFYLFASGWLAQRYGRPIILEVNEVAGVPRARGQVMVGLARSLEKRILRRADAVLTVSSFLADEVRRRGARPEVVHVVPNAVDPALFGAGGGAALRRSLGLEGATVVGFVGWFDHWDRLELLVEAVRDLRAAHRSLRLLLVGDGPVASQLRDVVRRDGLEGVVILAGAVPRAEVPQHVDAMDIGVLPASNPFGSPIALFELMVMGKSVVAPDLRPIRDVLEDGVTGLVVPEGDPAALKGAIGRLAGDAALRQRLGEAARARVLAHHTWQANARRVADLARELAARDRPATGVS